MVDERAQDDERGERPIGAARPRERDGAADDSHLVIITGCASGLGYALVRRYLDLGWTVCGIDIDAARMDERGREFRTRPYRGFVGDVADPSFVSRTARAITAIGRIEMLINNAGRPSFKAPVAYEAGDLDRCLTGLKGMMLWCIAVLRACGERDVTLVNVMSTAATRGNPHESAYCAAKWGERGYTESLKAAYHGTSVTVIGVYPGGIDTDFYRDSHDYVPPEKQHTFMNPEELAHVLADALTNPYNLTVSDIRIDRRPVFPGERAQGVKA